MAFAANEFSPKGLRLRGKVERRGKIGSALDDPSAVKTRIEKEFV